jgi:HK97 family phage major capsid protein
MQSIQAARETRAARAKALHDLVGKPTWDPATDQAVYDQTISEIDALDAQIERFNQANQRIAAAGLDESVMIAAERVARDQRSPGSAMFAAWIRAGLEGLNADQRLSIRNTMSTTTNSEGGFTVATDVASSVIEVLKNIGAMRRVADVIVTASGAPLSYPTSDGTAEVGELLAENAPATGLDPSFGTRALTAYKYSSKVIAVPFELLTDSAVDIEAFVRNRMAQRIGRITNAHFTTGSGTGQPFGVITAAATGKTGQTGQTTSVIYDDLVDLEHSVDVDYREGGRCAFMMNDLTLRSIRKIKDTAGRPIFVPGYDNAVGGQPARLLDHPLVINNDVAVMAANARSIAFGDFSAYKIRDVMGVEMFRFTDSAYTTKGQVGFLAWMRSGGNLTDVTGAVKVYINSAT